jgi:hypothetical protein
MEVYTYPLKLLGQICGVGVDEITQEDFRPDSDNLGPSGRISRHVLTALRTNFSLLQPEFDAKPQPAALQTRRKPSTILMVGLKARAGIVTQAEEGNFPFETCFRRSRFPKSPS